LGVVDRIEDRTSRVRAECCGAKGRVMFWFDWVVIASIALLAGAMIGAWKQSGSYYWSKYVLSGRKRGYRKAPVAPKAAVVTPQPLAQRYATQESAAPLAGVITRFRFLESLERQWRRSSYTGNHLCLAMLDLDRFK
jgi:hypothetical protein